MGRQTNNGSGGRAGGEIQTEHFQPIISLPEYGTGPPFVGDKKGFSSLESFTRPRRIISSPKQKGGKNVEVRGIEPRASRMRSERSTI